MADIVERLRRWSEFGYGVEATATMKEAATAIEEQRANVTNAAKLLSEQTAEIERLRAALVEMVQEDATNARRMRAAIVAAREKMAKTRFTWNGMIIQADGILEKALTVNNDRAALEGE